MTPTEIAERLDHEVIEYNARWAAEQLRITGRAVVRMVPGDMTVYKIIVIAPGTAVLNEGRFEASREYSVTLGNGLGREYPWHGSQMHCDYVTEKWAVLSPIWTGVVLTEFLNALSEALETP